MVLRRVLASANEAIRGTDTAVASVDVLQRWHKPAANVADSALAHDLPGRCVRWVKQGRWDKGNGAALKSSATQTEGELPAQSSGILIQPWRMAYTTA